MFVSLFTCMCVHIKKLRNIIKCFKILEFFKFILKPKFKHINWETFFSQKKKEKEKWNGIKREKSVKKITSSFCNSSLKYSDINKGTFYCNKIQQTKKNEQKIGHHLLFLISLNSNIDNTQIYIYIESVCFFQKKQTNWFYIHQVINLCLTKKYQVIKCVKLKP